MHFKKIFTSLTFPVATYLVLSCGYAAPASTPLENITPTPSSQAAVADALGWINVPDTRCGGHYIESAISTPESKAHPDVVQITSDQFLFSFHGTSESKGKITIRRYGQEITANKAYLYRDPQTGKLNTVDLIGNVRLREPNSLVIGHRGRFNRDTKETSLYDILYRTPVYNSLAQWRSIHPSALQIEEEHTILQLSAWGQASSFEQLKPKLFVFDNATYSTCPPVQNTWKVKANHIELNKETGRGEAYHAKLYIKNIPVLYVPYLNFPIDNRRKTGFLPPTLGVNNTSGPYFTAPFYWNMAPNYDSTITPALLSKRGIQITDVSRYLTPNSSGVVTLAVLPNDRDFREFQQSAATNANYINGSTTTQAELRRLLNASTTRKSFIWKDDTRFDDHWFGSVDYSYVSDDYYLRDFNAKVNEVTQNQLLQQVNLHYKGQYWNFSGRSQSYQTLHPIDSTSVQNQYSRYPQLVLNGSYPDEKTHLEYFVNNDLTHFNIVDTPGDTSKFPMGNRLNVQPGVAWAFTRPYLYFTPRLQVAMTQYDIGDIANTQSRQMGRVLPIFDVSSGLYFDRRLSFLNQSFLQTLEPQIYYTYIPYRNQNELPVFDTTLNMLNYDQLFVYNRFSNFDRIGDANQIAMGLVTRFINQQTGDEKIHVGVGQIYYFKNRQVTLCNPAQPGFCGATTNPDLQFNKSPLSGVLTYNVNPHWGAELDTIWNPITNQLDNQTFTLHYRPETNHLINFTYVFVRNGDTYPGEKIDKASNNLSQTDISAAWPLTRDWSFVGRWTQNLNRHNFQNLLSGVQYDSCCWAVRLVAGREFIGYNTNNTSQYNTEFYIQFALKGLGNLGSGDPTALLANNISGYQDQFGRDF